jgi:hypothetical protein
MTNQTTDHARCARTFMHLSGAMLTPDQAQFLDWARGVATSRTPVAAMRHILSAFLAEMAVFVGGPTALRQLIDKMVADSFYVRERSDNPIDASEVATMAVGLMLGWRMSQVHVAAALLSTGAQPSMRLNFDEVKRSGVPLPPIGFPGSPTDWAGRQEADTFAPYQDEADAAHRAQAAAAKPDNRTNPPVAPQDRYANQGLDDDGAPLVVHAGYYDLAKPHNDGPVS